MAFGFKSLVNMLTHNRNRADVTPKSKTADKAEDDVVAKLRDHPIFHELTKYRSVFIDTLTIADPLKKRMAACYLRIIFDVVEEILNDVVTNYKEYSKHITTLTSSMYQKYSRVESQARAQGVPEIFISKITPRIIENLLTLTGVVDDIHLQHRYNSEYDEILSFMDVYLLQLRYTYNAVGGIINGMNGELHRALEGSIFDDQ